MLEETWLQELSELLYNSRYQLLYSVLLILIVSLLKWLVNKFINNNVKDITIRYKWRKMTTYLSFIITLALILPIWLKGFKSFLTYLGLSTAGLAIALRDLIASFIGWVFIFWRRPFSIGDRIEIDGMAGDVIDIRLFQFSLIEIGNWVDADQSTGRVVHIPNNKILSCDISNYTAGFSLIWNEIPVLITFESDWERAKEILLSIAREESDDVEVNRTKIDQAAKKFLIYYGNLEPIVYTRVKESGVLLTIRYLCEPQQLRNSEGVIWENILKVFSQVERIELAYPTQRFYLKNIKERQGIEINDKYREGDENGD
ncbi:mechanosensitive ion channel domain-containing protein [Halocella sp. SP3-1]|uniref:mechanosensitive ion channel family protein n=1 Tax=Halocella sp. SP3-1 TaxID=2382161 RepID=UPI000F75A1E2|nr:mechanosensitive ion channel domain-containing protein [Halocella sp. SP3-1]AZO95077.1 mechanosensitive ion channel family protein [Halocella sp. SP3-1]